MVEAVTFNCPSCNAPLSTPADSQTVQCGYCFNTVIVPHELRETVGTPAAAVDVNEIREMLARGQKVEAVKLVRQATGLGLKESKDLVDAIERGEDMQVVFDMLAAFQPATQALDSAAVVVTIDADADRPQQVTADAQKVGKAVGIAGVSLTCLAVAVAVIVLLATLIPLYFVFRSNADELAPVLGEAVLPSTATLELQFGESGIGPGQFDDPRAIAADRDGNIYVGDYSTGRLQSFDAQGSFRWLVNLGEDNYIQALDVDQSGVLLLVSRGAIRRFETATGAELDPFPNPDDLYFDDLSVAPDGRIAVIADSEDVLVYDSGYNLLMSIPDAVSSVSNDSELEGDIDMDGLGNIYVLGGFNSAVFKYTPDGRFTNRISSAGDKPGQLTAPGDLAVDGQGNVYISDFDGVQVFDGDGLYLDYFSVSGFVFGLNFDLQDKLYAASNKPLASRYAVNP